MTFSSHSIRLLKSIVTICIVFSVLISIAFTSGGVEQRNKTHSKSEPFYLFENGEFHLVVDQAPCKMSSDTLLTKRYGVDCKSIFYLSKPVKSTKRIKRVIITLEQGDSATNISEKVCKQIQELKIYSVYPSQLPGDIGRFFNLRNLYLEFGVGDMCSPSKFELNESPWQPGNLSALVKLESLIAYGVYIDPLQLKSNSLKELNIPCDMMSPYAVQKLLPLASFRLNVEYHYQSVLVAMVRYLKNGRVTHTIPFSHVDSIALDNNFWGYNYYATDGKLVATTYSQNGQADSTWKFLKDDGLTEEASVRFRNDTLLQFSYDWLRGKQSMRYEKQNYFHSRLLSKETFNTFGVNKKETFRFDNGSIIIVREFTGVSSEPTTIKYYHSGEQERTLTVNDQFLKPFEPYFNN